jgi:2',3'-cyclic-nucleotide 2'-phosphodiesterase/3'-nucleotidase
MLRTRHGAICALLAAALAAACGKSGGKATGQVAVTIAAGALARAADVGSVLVTLTNVDTQWSATAEIGAPGSDGRWSRTFAGVPAGRYTFFAEARDAAGQALFRTPQPYPSEPVNVWASQVTRVNLLLQEVRPPDPYRNSAPYFLTVTASERNLDAARSVLLAATAADPDGDPLAFTWSGPGTFGPQAGSAGASSVTWTPPGAGDFSLKVTVADGRGASASFSISIHVGASGASVVAIIDLNSAPVVTGVTAEILAGSPVMVTAVATDVDGDPITFGAWSADCQGAFGTPVTGPGATAGTFGSTVSFTPAAGQTGYCTLSVTVSDGRGGSNSGSLRFSLADVAVGENLAPRTLAILETSDLHSNLMPWNYFSAAADSTVGLTKIATLVAQERAANPCSLLVDDGDTIQGTPLGTYYALVDQTSPHPMAVAMNALRYDTMTAGNHEFNYGLATLARFQRDAAFPVLSANVRRRADGAPAFVPYVIKSVCGVKVGILGLTTPGITTWDAENTKDLLVDLPVDAAARYVPEMRQNGAEVIVVAFHAGPDRQPTTSGAAGWLTDVSTWVDNGSMPHENDVIELAQQVPGIDVVLTGHTHLQIPKMLVGSTIVVQPYRWGSHLAEVTLNVDHAAGRWAVTSRDSRLLSVSSVQPDAALTALAQPYHDATVAYVEATIGNAVAPFPGGDQARFTDGALGDLINTVQMDAAQKAGFPVDVSLAAIFNNTGMIPQGPVKLRDAYSAYIYDNTLYVQQITGRTLRTALEQDAAYFVTLDPAHLPATAAGTKDPNARDYNWDLYSGIDYTIDLTKPAGQRVTRLQLRGQDVTDDQVIRIAINNYRAGGGGYPAFAGSPILWKSADGVRDFLAAYVASHPNLDPAAVNVCNMTLVPDLFARYFPGISQKCSSPLSGTISGSSVVTPGQSARLSVTAPAGGWSVTWSDGLSGAQRGGFSTSVAGNEFDATYTPAACVELGFGDHALTITATGNNAAAGQSVSVPLTITVRCPAQATGPVAVKVLAINDLHGQIGTGKVVSGRAVGSAPILAAYLRTAMAGVESRTVIAEVGDLVGASPADSALFQDEPTVMFFNQLANDRCAASIWDPGCNLVGAPGNHEFDEGVDELLRLLGGGNHAKGPFLQDPWQGARFPVVSANIRKADGALLFRPWVVKYLDGVQVGFIGATLSSTPTIVLPSGVAGLTFEDEAAAINAQVKELQARGVHAIVVVLHDSAPASFVAQLDADVDVVLTGHAHVLANARYPNAGGKQVLVTQAYSAGTAFANIDLTVDGATQDVTAASATVPTTYAAGITPDAAAADLLAKADALVAPLVSAQVATTNGILSTSLNTAGESTLGDVLAEAHRRSMSADFGITNPGGMRANLPVTCASSPCAITWGDCFTSQPFANQVMRVTLTGQQLKDALEQQFAGWNGQSSTRMLQIAGFAYTWSAGAPLGSRVISLRKADGTPIDLGASYTVAMNNFLQGGGDGFTVLVGGTNVVPGPIDLDALLDYLRAQAGPLVPATDGRVTRVP